MPDPNAPHVDEKVLVRRGRIDAINLYEVKEHELEVLEKGSTETLQFNFAIFLFSTAFTAIVALATSNFKWQTVKTIFLLISIVGILHGTYLILSWWRSRTARKKVTETIRNRIKEQPMNDDPAETIGTDTGKPEDDRTPYG